MAILETVRSRPNTIMFMAHPAQAQLLESIDLLGRLDYNPTAHCFEASSNLESDRPKTRWRTRHWEKCPSSAQFPVMAACTSDVSRHRATALQNFYALGVPPTLVCRLYCTGHYSLWVQSRFHKGRCSRTLESSRIPSPQTPGRSIIDSSGTGSPRQYTHYGNYD